MFCIFLLYVSLTDRIINFVLALSTEMNVFCKRTSESHFKNARVIQHGVSNTFEFSKCCAIEAVLSGFVFFVCLFQEMLLWAFFSLHYLVLCHKKECVPLASTIPCIWENVNCSGLRQHEKYLCQ